MGSLLSLDMSYFKGEFDDFAWASQLGARIPLCRLRKFKLDSCSTMSPAGLNALIGNCMNLKYLSMNNHSIDWDRYGYIFKKLRLNWSPSLDKLGLVNYLAYVDRTEPVPEDFVEKEDYGRL